MLQSIAAANTAAPFQTDDIVHFDFTPANILVAAGEISGVIDWEGACRGDSVFDLASMLFYCYEIPELATNSGASRCGEPTAA